jgi:hypothetical protein
MVNGASPERNSAMRHWLDTIFEARLAERLGARGSLVAGVLAGGLFAAGLLAGELRAEPVDLSLDDLDEMVAGAYEPNWRPIDRGSFQRFTSITTSISMPIANSFAICFMCSGNAAAIAVSNAYGNARADASSFASGLGQAFSRADAAGPAFVFVLPDFLRQEAPSWRP